MFTFQIDKESAERFKGRFGKEWRRRAEAGLAGVRQEWQQEFRRQDERMQKVWTPLKTWVDGKTASKEGSFIGRDPRSYAERKKRAYYRGKSGKSPVRYLRILKRTGVMLARYISGISINNRDLRVKINFPSGQIGQRAMSHQGYDRQGNPVGLPQGVRAHRPYDMERFKFVADRALRREFNKG